MSELNKLTQKWQQAHSRRFTKHLGQYYKAVDKLQKECKHEKTHWIQEIAKDGSFPEDTLTKRCFVCGANIDKFNVGVKLAEHFLTVFDKNVEEAKAASTLVDGESKQ